MKGNLVKRTIDLHCKLYVSKIYCFFVTTQEALTTKIESHLILVCIVCNMVLYSLIFANKINSCKPGHRRDSNAPAMHYLLFSLISALVKQWEVKSHYWGVEAEEGSNTSFIQLGIFSLTCRIVYTPFTISF